MAQLLFRKIGIIARSREVSWAETLTQLLQALAPHVDTIYIEEETAELAQTQNYPRLSRHDFGTKCDLLIVIGGDGSLLQAAHWAVDANLPLLGINRGSLGFLTDVQPSLISSRLPPILAGQYQKEFRHMLTAQVHSDGKTIYNEDALNEVVLLPGRVAHMIEFTIFVDEQFVCRQRADGLIVATPTGSTAYALSGGGPIIHPGLPATCLVPMFPHTLSSRPLVVANSSVIRLEINHFSESSPGFSCDGFPRRDLAVDEVVVIQPKAKPLCLIHPLEYDYYETLRSKLSWEKQQRLSLQG